MMHGRSSSHEIYVQPAETLQKHAGCIIYDHRGHGGSLTMETLASDLNEILSKCSESVLKSLGVSMKLLDNRPAVEQITVPFTCFYAEPGSLFSPKLAEWYKEHVPTQFNAVCFPDSNHMLVSDYPEKFTQEVIAVLDQ